MVLHEEAMTPIPSDLVDEKPEIVLRPPVAIPIADIDFGPIRPLTRFDKERWDWTVFRMQKTWPHLTEDKARTQLYSASTSNDFTLLCHNAAVGLAHAERHPLSGEKWCRQIFLYIQAEQNRFKKTRISAGGQLYRAFERWARNHGAVRFEMEDHSDVDPAEIVECYRGAFRDVAFRDLMSLPQL